MSSIFGKELAPGSRGEGAMICSHLDTAFTSTLPFGQKSFALPISRVGSLLDNVNMQWKMLEGRKEQAWVE